MSTESEKLIQSTALTWVDKLSCVGLIGGTTVSLITQNVACATVPFSLILTAQIFARQKKVAALVEAHQSIANSVQMVESTIDSLTQNTEETLQEQERAIDILTQADNKHNLEAITLKERLEEKAKTIAEQAGQLDALDSTLSNIKGIAAVASLDNEVVSAEVHFTRGTHQEKLGHLEVAIKDYSQAIEYSPDFAEAYLRRGLAKAELGRKQSAVIDFNIATKHFFDVGDLVNYQRAKDIAAKTHAAECPVESVINQDEAEVKEPQLVSINGLFGG